MWFSGCLGSVAETELMKKLFHPNNYNVDALPPLSSQNKSSRREVRLGVNLLRLNDIVKGFNIKKSIQKLRIISLKCCRIRRTRIWTHSLRSRLWVSCSIELIHKNENDEVNYRCGRTKDWVMKKGDGDSMFQVRYAYLRQKFGSLLSSSQICNGFTSFRFLKKFVHKI